MIPFNPLTVARFFKNNREVIVVYENGRKKSVKVTKRKYFRNYSKTTEAIFETIKEFKY